MTISVWLFVSFMVLEAFQQRLWYDAAKYRDLGISRWTHQYTRSLFQLQVDFEDLSNKENRNFTNFFKSTHNPDWGLKICANKAFKSGCDDCFSKPDHVCISVSCNDSSRAWGNNFTSKWLKAFHFSNFVDFIADKRNISKLRIRFRITEAATALPNE